MNLHFFENSLAFGDGMAYTGIYNVSAERESIHYCDYSVHSYKLELI